jgi:uncharacterized protein YndB with AHSA1/START domain
MDATKRSPAEPESARELVINREFEVPARVLFEAHAKSELVMGWFGPKGYPLALCEIDFRVGGKYRFAMKGPDGKLMTPFGGEYLAIETDRKIAYSNTFELPGAETMIVTVTFDEAAGRTQLTHHTLFASVAMKELHVGWGYEAGVGSALTQLAELGTRQVVRS